MTALVLLFACRGEGITAEECADRVDQDDDGRVDCAERDCDEFASCGNGAVPVMNEFMANNANGYTDEAGEFEDWVELYNPSPDAVALAGWSLSDDPDVPNKSLLPDDLVISGTGFLVLFADDEPTGDLHLLFKLAREGGVVVLARDGVVVDRLAYPQQETDRSLARTPDGGVTWVSTAAPTPGAPRE